MKNTSNGPRFSPADLQNDPKAAHDALLHWDEQSEQILRLLAEHPEHGGRLDTLQRADGWLRQRAADSIVARTQNGEHGPGPASLACPSADELYDFAAGPGASPLRRDRQLAIDRHLAACASCDSFVATLATAPPSPLILGLDESVDAAPDTSHDQPAPIRRFPMRRVLVPIAAAAAIVLAIGVWRAFTPTTTRAAWPAAPLLRGETADALLWPRGRILERSESLARVAPALATAIPFELGPTARLGSADAAGYRLQVFRTEGGAFDAPTAVAEWSPTSAASASPVLFAAGHYTWKAWTRERGLDVELGSRDFEVVPAEAVLRELAAILESGGPDAGVRAVALLDARGFRADARALARTLPPSPERDAYLGRTPGR
ncbi:MAG: hypothetical protein NTY35_08050 [Planctomycetota bacterium]|nr:hypothetical protein [Planctomycetota bacterium]